jgi:hypothetical protein
MMMPEFLGPHDHPKKGPQGRGKYPWDEWLIPGEHTRCHQETDFPGTKAEHFRQAAYNAGSKRRLSISAELPEGPEGTIVDIYVHPEEK